MYKGKIIRSHLKNFFEMASRSNPPDQLEFLNERW